jgi:hypothetical protein
MYRVFRAQKMKHPRVPQVDLIAEFCLIFILMKISANFVYYYTSYVVCYKNCRCFFYQ